MKKLVLLLCFVSLLTLSTIVLAADGIKYDFDQVEVVHAAEFVAKPLNMNNNWLAALAGGTNKPVQVIYGVVNLKKDGKTQITEEYIKVSGQNGSERFLLNSRNVDSNSITSSFWSAKKIIGNSVVKDFTPPIRTLVLNRTMDPGKGIQSITFVVSEEGDKAKGDTLQYGKYQADLTTLKYSGDPWAKLNGAGAN